MTEEIRFMSDDLRRQRRSLMVVCLVLIFMKYSGLKITKFPLLGGEFTLENENAVYALLWAMWFYFLWRFYGYYRQDGLANLRTAWQWSNDTFFATKIVDYVKTQYPQLEKSKTIKVEYAGLGRNWFVKKYTGLSFKTMEGEQVETILIPIWKFWKERLKAIIHFVRNRSQFTGYLLPFLLAIGSLLYCGVGWQGSPWNLISK